MKRLIKIKATDEYVLLEEADVNLDIHIDRTNSIAYWHLNRHLADYYYIRMRIKESMVIAGGFNALKSNEDKDTVLIYTKNVDVIDAIEYYTNIKGMLQEEAAYLLVVNGSIDIRKSAIALGGRLDAPKFTEILIIGLGKDNASEVLRECRNFFSDIKNAAILGKEYDSLRVGFFDYIEGTNDYSDLHTGLSSFFTLPDEEDKLNALITNIKDYLYYGNYI